MNSATPEAPAARSGLRAVALPAEHGGWGLTLEPCLLGLLVAPGAAGLCIAGAALLAFLARTPLKLAVVDRRRGRRLERTVLATRVATVEVAMLVALAVAAVLLGATWFWVPAVAAAPLVAVEGWYEVRSRGRRLVPELAGAVAVCAVAPMIVLADDGPALLAVGLWLVLAARVATSIPFVRAEIARLHGRPASATVTLVADGVALAAAAIAVALDQALIAGALAVAAVVVAQRLGARRPVPRPVVLGLRQMTLGVGVVVITALGVALT